MLFSTSAVSKKLLFATPVDKENFIFKVEELRMKLQNQKALNAKDTALPIKQFVGCVNISLLGEKSSLDDKILPRDRDLYILGCHNCEYQVPPGFHFSAKAHWVYLILQHLGNDFEIVKISAISNRIVTAIIVRKTYSFDISNIELSYAVSIPKPQQVEEEEPVGFTSKTFSFFRSITAEVKKGFTADSNTNYTEDDYIGQGK